MRQQMLVEVLKRHRLEVITPQGDPEQALTILWSSNLERDLLAWATPQPWWRRLPTPVQFPVDTIIVILVLAFLASVWWFSARVIQVNYVPWTEHSKWQREVSALSKRMDQSTTLAPVLTPVPTPVPTPERRKWTKPIFWTRHE